MFQQIRMMFIFQLFRVGVTFVFFLPRLSLNFFDHHSGGCCKAGYDTTYSAHLTGVISQSEFRESIDNINNSRASRTPTVICFVIFFLCIIGGIVLFIVGGVTASGTAKYGFPVSVGVGMGVFGFGMHFLIVSLCISAAINSGRLQKAVARESEKYSSRSPTPCSWRVHTTRVMAGTMNNRRTDVQSHVSHLA